ncbi:MAG TPA: Sec-independent protein translocase protein TatB [Caulobacteraceae bacterium]|nr:Sec-independent protein translocase protein TatB [Caulobacteraceae bacterium]
MFPEGRLFDFLIVGAIALIVVGPKDLPVLMRKAGQFMARARAMAAEFRASFDELARQSELDELRREVDSLRAARPLDFAASQIGAGEVFSDIHQGLADANHELTGPAVVAPALSEPPTLAPADEAVVAPKRLSRSKAATP